MTGIKKVTLASFPDRAKGPQYKTYLALEPTQPIGKGHRQCITGTIALYNQNRPPKKQCRIGFNGSIVLGCEASSSKKEVVEVVELVAHCLGHEGPIPIEINGDLVNPGLALVLPGSDVAKMADPKRCERGTTPRKQPTKRRY